MLAAAVALPLTQLGCNTSNSPSTLTNATGGLCRTYVTSEFENMTPATVRSGASITGSYDPSTRQLTYVEAFSVGGPICSTTVYTYASTADFVDEVSVVPPRMLLTSQTTTNRDTCGTGTTTVTYTYDAARRLTKASSSDGTSTTYTNWDVSGRPTSGSISSGGPVSIAYDTGARTATITRSSGSGPTTTQLTFDTNGILIMSVDSTGLTTTFNVTGTSQICK